MIQFPELWYTGFPFSTFKVFNTLHPVTIESEIEVTLLGMVSDSRLMHEENASGAIFSRLFGKDMDENSHKKKAAYPMLFTLSGILIYLKLQTANA